MVSFARARTRSLISRLWPLRSQTTENDAAESDQSKELITQQQEQNKVFFEASKNGGIWLS